MDDKLSIKSSDSVTTSGEYEIVPEELEIQSTTQPLGTSPTLKIANNGNFNDLEKNLNEVIHELDDTTTVNDNMDTTLTGQSHNETGKYTHKHTHTLYFQNIEFHANGFVPRCKCNV